MTGKPPSALKKDDDIHDNEEPEMSQARREWLRDYVAVSMGIRTIPKVLDEVSFEGIARYIASGKAHNIITMAGAGISTSAGIPDYRSPGTGLYDQLKKEYDVKDPQELNSIDFFKKDPRPFFKRSKLFFKDVFKPTPCHYFIRMLHEKGLLLRHYSQNIDTLERSAGLPEDKLLEAHGSWNTSHCLKCGKQYSKQFMKEAVMADQIPTCAEGECAGTIKPDIVLFGETLPRHFAERVEEDFLKCDLLIIMGTSLVVQPFATLPSKVPMATPRLYVNRERGQTGATHPMTALFFGGGFQFDSKDNVRDVFKEADCDAGCLEMADLLGWGKELCAMIEHEHRRIDQMKTKDPTIKPVDTNGPAKVATKQPAKSAANQTAKSAVGQPAKSVNQPPVRSVNPSARSVNQSAKSAGQPTKSAKHRDTASKPVTVANQQSKHATRKASR